MQKSHQQAPELHFPNVRLWFVYKQHGLLFFIFTFVLSGVDILSNF